MKIVANIGKNIAELRKSRKKTAEQLAEALRVSRQTISKWENGETIPNAYNVLDMATYLDVSVSDIYGQILVDRIVKDTTDEKKSFPELIGDLIVDSYSEGLDAKKSLHDSMVAFDRSFIPFEIQKGFNEIKYGDILRRLSNGYVIGIKENEYPVEAQIIKTEKFIIPAFVEYLNENGILAFYYESRVIGDLEGALLLLVENEYEILRFKELTKIFFIGLAEFKNHKWLRALYANTVGGVKPKKRRFEVAIFNSEEASLREVDFEDNMMYLVSKDTKKEVDSLLDKLFSLDRSAIKELFDFAGFDGDLIVVNDNEDKDFLFAYELKKTDEDDEYVSYKIRKSRPFDISFANTERINDKEHISEKLERYMTFDSGAEMDAEVERIMSLGKKDLESLLRRFNNANYMVVFNNVDNTWTIYDMKQPKPEIIYTSGATCHPESTENLTIKE